MRSLNAVSAGATPLGPLGNTLPGQRRLSRLSWYTTLQVVVIEVARAGQGRPSQGFLLAWNPIPPVPGFEAPE